MRIPNHSLNAAANSFGRRAGYSLPELMVAMTVFILLLGGVIFANLYGLSMFRITETKLTATDDARKTLGKIANEIRSCKNAWIGNIKSSGNKSNVFEALLDGEKQEGNSLIIYPTTNTANFVIYFANPADQTFRRTTSTPGSAVIVAESVTNAIAFRAQDHLGNLLTNQNSRVFHLTLEFFRPKRRLQVADYYKIETSVTKRALE